MAAIDVKQSALDAVASYEHYPDVLILATDTVEKSLEKIDGVTSSEYSGLDATVLATDHPAAFELAAALHVEITEWKMEEAEQMRQWYCSGASSGKNVIVMD